MKALLAAFLAVSVGLFPLFARSQESQGDDDDDSCAQSTQDSSDETTRESTNEPLRNTTDPTVELIEGVTGYHDKPTESEGDYTDRARFMAVGVSGLTLALVIVAVVAAATHGSRNPEGTTTTPPVPSIHEARAAAWLAENDEQLRVDLARGQGPTLDDLAAAFALRPERRTAFGSAMRRRRGDLLARLTVPPASGGARPFLREVGVVLREDAETHEDWENWRRTYGVAIPQ